MSCARLPLADKMINNKWFVGYALLHLFAIAFFQLKLIGSFSLLLRWVHWLHAAAHIIQHAHTYAKCNIQKRINLICITFQKEPTIFMLWCVWFFEETKNHMFFGALLKTNSKSKKNIMKTCVSHPYTKRECNVRCVVLIRHVVKMEGELFFFETTCKF